MSALREALRPYLGTMVCIPAALLRDVNAALAQPVHCGATYPHRSHQANTHGAFCAGVPLATPEPDR